MSEPIPGIVIAEPISEELKDKRNVLDRRLGNSLFV